MGKVRVAYRQCLCIFQAITTFDLNLQSIPALCGEIVAQWPNIRDFMTKDAPSQSGQGVRGRVSFLLFR